MRIHPLTLTVALVAACAAWPEEARSQQIDLTCSASALRASQPIDCEATPNDSAEWRHYWVVEDLDGRVDLSRYWPHGHHRDPHYRIVFRRHGDYIVRVGVRPRYDHHIDWAYLDWPVRVTEPWYDRRWAGIPVRW